MTDREKLRAIRKAVKNVNENDIDSLWQAVYDVIVIVKPSRLMFCGCDKCKSRAVREGK